MTIDSSAANTKLLWIAIILSIVAIILSGLALYRSAPVPALKRLECCNKDGGGLGHWRDSSKTVCEGGCPYFAPE